MDFLTIILLGLGFNLVVSIFVSILYIGIFLGISVDIAILNKTVEKLESVKARAKLNKIWYFRQKDFINILPYAGGIYTLFDFIKSINYGVTNYIFEQTQEKIEYIEKLLESKS